MVFNKKGQIWVETVIYTLMAFVMIGLVLTFVNPKLKEIQDQIIVKQAIDILSDINFIIENIGVSGNTRILELTIKKGDLYIDGVNEQIYFEIDSNYQYSEYGENVTYGKILINSKNEGSLSKITLVLNYTQLYNITFKNEEKIKKISWGATPYKLTISNKGGNPINMDFDLN